MMETRHIYYSILIQCVAWCEIITLIKNNNVTCVFVEDSVYSPLYISSLNHEGQSNGQNFDQRVLNPKFYNVEISLERPLSFAMLENDQIECSICNSNHDHCTKLSIQPGKDNSNNLTLCKWLNYTLTKVGKNVDVSSLLRKRHSFEFIPVWIQFQVEYNHNKNKTIKADIYHYTLSSSSTIISKNGTDYKLCKKVGFLGTLCNISCAHILGKAYKKCENHKICSDNQCTCAWGYNGDACDQRIEKNVDERTSYPDEEQDPQKNVFNRSDQSETKKLSASNSRKITVQQQIKEISVYCRNESTLWIRWKAPKTFLNYTIHYQDDPNKWNPSSYSYFCPDWKGFTCTVLKHLKSDTNYNISIQLRDADPVYVVGRTEARKLQMSLHSKPFSIVASYDDCGSVYRMDMDIISSRSQENRSVIENKDGHYLMFPVNEDDNFELVSVDRGKKWMLDLCNSYQKTDDFSENEYEIINTYDKAKIANLSLDLHKETGRTFLIKNKNKLMYLIHISDHKLTLCSVGINHAGSFELHHILFIVSLFLVPTLFIAALLLYIRRNKYCATKSNPSEEMLLLKELCLDVHKSEFESYVQDTGISDKLLHQFETLSGRHQEYEMLDALQNDNKAKNRRKDYVPYDHNRVILRPLGGVPSNEDYINATYIDGLETNNAYIACQGPKFNTVTDFWRMVWQENVKTIVMCTNFIENEERMCAEYWPPNLGFVAEYSTFKIKLVEEEYLENYVKRLLEISYRYNKRVVEHLHLGWGLGRPFYPNDAVPFVRNLRIICAESDATVVFHSGFGVGRCAALILCDLALEMIYSLKTVNFFNLTQGLREQRPQMLNQKEYYVLAHLIISECLMAENNPFMLPIEETPSDEVIDQQISFLEKLCWHDKVVQSLFPRNEVGKTGKYCSLIHVDGFDVNTKFVVMKPPSKQLFANFWSTVAKEEVNYIVVLNELRKSKKLNLCSFDGTYQSEVVKVRKIESDDKYHCTITKIKLSVSKYHKAEKLKNVRRIDLVELKNWDHQKFPDTSIDSILNTIHYITTNTQTAPSILTICCDGFSASGIFLGLFYIIEKYKKCSKIDVCNSIRVVRRSCAQFINSLNELKFLYTCVRVYLSTLKRYETLGNLKDSSS